MCKASRQSIQKNTAINKTPRLWSRLKCLLFFFRERESTISKFAYKTNKYLEKNIMDFRVFFCGHGKNHQLLIQSLFI